MKLLLPISLGALALASGCASSPDADTTQIVRAEATIDNAAQTGAPEFGATSLDDAREKLAAARVASDEGEHELAARLAEEAELDAERAIAKAEASEAQAALKEVHDGIETLRRELEQGSYGPGGTQ